MTTVASGRAVDAVTEALDTVRDPELDEPITTLGFVASCVVSADGLAEVHLRLPTFFCAPNFAFLMVADAHDAVSAVPGVIRTVVVLDDHFASDAINAGVAARAGFVGTFESQTAGELDTLRADFVRKAVLAGTDRVCRPLVRDGVDLSGLTLGDVPPSPELNRLRERRREIGLPAGDDAALLVDVVTGAPITDGDVRRHLARARLSHVNIEANTGICRDMLAARYGVTTEESA